MIKVVLDWYRALNNRDFKTLLNSLSENVEFTDYSSKKFFQGKSQSQRQFEHLFKAFPDARVDVLNAFSAGEHVITELLAQGTHTRTMTTQYGQLLPIGGLVKTRFCQIHRIKNGKIESCRSYYDSRDLQQALGIGSGNLPQIKVA